MNIGPRVKYLRNKNNLSAKELGSKVDLDQTMIYKIERNEANPSLDSLERICTALNVPLDVFYFGIIHPQAETYVFHKLKEEINARDLSDAEKKLLLNALTGELISSLIEKTSQTDNILEITLTEDIQEIIQKYKSLSPKQQEALKVFLDSFIHQHQ
ncbi:MAG: putative transcriptional regulator [Firmicutes bacterium]|nr:putative transcriptional regulator [Bacillota bacterium]